MAKGLSNWQKLLRQDKSESLQYRDVYGDQQLDRSYLPEAKSKTPYRVVAILLTVLVMLVSWVFISLWQLVVGGSTAPCAVL